VIDVSTPSAPSEVGFVDTPGIARDVAVDTSHAYVADGYTGLRVIAVSVPTAPVEVAFTDWPGNAMASSVAVASGYLYLAESTVDDGSDSPTFLRVIDVSEPTAPEEVGNFQTAAWGRSAIALSDEQVFVTGSEMLVFARCEVVFSDGFESGDTSAWSATVP
jgi:hypothetical protein